MARRRPFILISPSTDPKGVEFDDFSLSLSMRYPLAVQGAGGQPWMCPCVPEREFVAEAVRRSDGVLLTGGDDVEPQLYGEKPASAVAATVHPEAPERDLFELMLIDEVFRQQKPLLAICRGLQILNVALGGTLIADIPSQVPGALRHNRSDRKDRIVHDVAVVPGSHLGRLAPSGRLGVNSSHHQAVAKLAKPLRATAVSKDGIIEGLELAPHAAWMTRYLLAVQFHPERLFTRHAEHLALFQGFIRACRRAVDGDRV